MKFNVENRSFRSRSLKPVALSLVLALCVFPAHSQEANQAPMPQQTTETYGDWLLRCNQRQEEEKTCEIVTWVTATAENGARDTILQMAIGQSPEAEQLHAVIRVPLSAALNKPVELALSPADENADEAQEQVLPAEYFLCQPAGCLARVDLPDASLTLLRAAQKLALRMTLAGREETLIPISSDGLSATIERLTAPSP